MMDVFMGPYKHFSVNDLQNVRPPNPRCCDGQGPYCPECATAILHRAGITVNNANPSGLTPVPPPYERPPEQESPTQTGCGEPPKYSPQGRRLTYVPLPYER